MRLKTQRIKKRKIKRIILISFLSLGAVFVSIIFGFGYFTSALKCNNESKILQGELEKVKYFQNI